MESQTTKKNNITVTNMATNDPNFAIICAFFDRFADILAVDKLSIEELSSMLENSEEVPNELRELHVKLLRKARKTVHPDKWEKALIKFCQTYSFADSWEVERFGYKKANITVKLRILKTLLEAQFDANIKFKNTINMLTSTDLRSEPIGKDNMGNVYWSALDEKCNLKIYRENVDDEKWKVVASNRGELVNLIERLKGNDPIGCSSDDLIDEDSSSNNSVTTKSENKDAPIAKTEDSSIINNEEDKGVYKSVITSKEPDKNENSNKNGDSKPGISLILSRRSYKKEEFPSESVTAPEDEEFAKRLRDNEDYIKSNLNTKRPKLLQNHKKPVVEDEEDYDDEEDFEEEDDAEEEADDEEEEDDGEYSEEIVEPVMYVKGEGSGKNCKGSPLVFDEDNVEFGDTIEEEIMFVYGEGSGADCLIGNPVPPKENATTESEKSKDNSSPVTTPSATGTPKPLFFFGRPGCLQNSPTKPPSLTPAFGALSNPIGMSFGQNSESEKPNVLKLVNYDTDSNSGSSNSNATDQDNNISVAENSVKSETDSNKNNEKPSNVSIDNTESQKSSTSEVIDKETVEQEKALESSKAQKQETITEGIDDSKNCQAESDNKTQAAIKKVDTDVPESLNVDSLVDSKAQSDGEESNPPSSLTEPPVNIEPHSAEMALEGPQIKSKESAASSNPGASIAPSESVEVPTEPTTCVEIKSSPSDAQSKTENDDSKDVLDSQSVPKPEEEIDVPDNIIVHPAIDKSESSKDVLIKESLENIHNNNNNKQAKAEEIVENEQDQANLEVIKESEDQTKIEKDHSTKSNENATVSEEKSKEIIENAESAAAIPLTFNENADVESAKESKPTSGDHPTDIVEENQSKQVDEIPPSAIDVLPAVVEADSVKSQEDIDSSITMDPVGSSMESSADIPTTEMANTKTKAGILEPVVIPQSNDLNTENEPPTITGDSSTQSLLDTEQINLAQETDNKEFNEGKTETETSSPDIANDLEKVSEKIQECPIADPIVEPISATISTNTDAISEDIEKNNSEIKSGKNLDDYLDPISNEMDFSESSDAGDTVSKPLDFNDQDNNNQSKDKSPLANPISEVVTSNSIIDSIPVSNDKSVLVASELTNSESHTINAKDETVILLMNTTPDEPPVVQLVQENVNAPDVPDIAMPTMPEKLIETSDIPKASVTNDSAEISIQFENQNIRTITSSVAEIPESKPEELSVPANATAVSCASDLSDISSSDNDNFGSDIEEMEMGSDKLQMADPIPVPAESISKSKSQDESIISEKTLTEEIIQPIPESIQQPVESSEKITPVKEPESVESTQSISSAADLPSDISRVEEPPKNVDQEKPLLNIAKSEMPENKIEDENVESIQTTSTISESADVLSNNILEEETVDDSVQLEKTTVDLSQAESENILKDDIEPVTIEESTTPVIEPVIESAVDLKVTEVVENLEQCTTGIMNVAPPNIREEYISQFNNYVPKESVVSTEAPHFENKSVVNAVPIPSVENTISDAVNLPIEPSVITTELAVPTEQFTPASQTPLTYQTLRLENESFPNIPAGNILSNSTEQIESYSLPKNDLVSVSDQINVPHHPNLEKNYQHRICDLQSNKSSTEHLIPNTVQPEVIVNKSVIENIGPESIAQEKDNYPYLPPSTNMATVGQMSYGYSSTALSEDTPGMLFAEKPDYSMPPETAIPYRADEATHENKIEPVEDTSAIRLTDNTVNDPIVPVISQNSIDSRTILPVEKEITENLPVKQEVAEEIPPVVSVDPIHIASDLSVPAKFDSIADIKVEEIVKEPATILPVAIEQAVVEEDKKVVVEVTVPESKVSIPADAELKAELPPKDIFSEIKQVEVVKSEISPVKIVETSSTKTPAPANRKRRLSEPRARSSESESDQHFDDNVEPLANDDVSEDEDVGGKRIKMRTKHVDSNFRKEIEAKKIEENVSSSGSDDDTKKRPKISPKRKKALKDTVPADAEPIISEKKMKEDDTPAKVTKGKGGKAKKPTPAKTAPKEEAGAKPGSKFSFLIRQIDTSLVLDTADSEPPVRQSRRIAQQKIREETERRQMEEKLLKQMKAESEKKKLQGESANSNSYKEFSTDGDGEGEEEDSKDTQKKKKKKKKGNPWQTSSSESSDTEQEEEIEEHEPSDDDRHQVIKSDHEFSPESDIEDEQVVPTKRARTLKKDTTVDEVEEDYNPNHACQKCKKTDHPEWILLCDNCDHGYHCSCLKPVLFIIPEGDWFCPVCQQEKLIENLTKHLNDYDVLVKQFEIAENRRKRLAYVEVSVDNVLSSNQDKRKNRSRSRSSKAHSVAPEEFSSSSSNESNSDLTDSDDEPIYKLRKRNQTNVSYRFNEYDDLINSAIRREMDEVQGAGNLGRGKDISTIIEADKDDQKLNSPNDDGEQNDESKLIENDGDEDDDLDDIPLKVKPIAEKKMLDSDSDSEPIRRPMKKTTKKKKKLNNLDASSDDDGGSDEDFKGSSDESEDSENYSLSNASESSLDYPKKKNKAGRRTTRAANRQKRYDTEFIDDDDSDYSPADKGPKKKKKKPDSDDYDIDDDDDEDDEEEEDLDSDDLCDDTETDSSNSDWRSKKKKRSAPSSKKKRPEVRPLIIKKKKVTRVDEDDRSFRAGISAKKIRKEESEVDDDASESSKSQKRTTRGRKMHYIEDFESSDDGGITPGVKRPDTPPEERELFIKKQEEIKRMLAEKDADIASQFPADAVEGEPVVLDSISTVPLQVIESAKALDADFLKSKHADSEDFDGFPEDFDPEDMDDEDLAKMMEEEDFAQQQLKLAGEAIARKKLKDQETKKTSKDTAKAKAPPKPKQAKSPVGDPKKRGIRKMSPDIIVPPIPEVPVPIEQPTPSPLQSLAQSMSLHQPHLMTNPQYSQPQLPSIIQSPYNVLSQMPISQISPAPLEPIIPTTVLSIQSPQANTLELSGSDYDNSPVKKRGRRKKFTPLRDDLGKGGPVLNESPEPKHPDISKLPSVTPLPPMFPSSVPSGVGVPSSVITRLLQPQRQPSMPLGGPDFSQSRFFNASQLKSTLTGSPHHVRSPYSDPQTAHLGPPSTTVPHMPSAPPHFLHSNPGAGRPPLGVHPMYRPPPSTLYRGPPPISSRLPYHVPSTIHHTMQLNPTVNSRQLGPRGPAHPGQFGPGQFSVYYPHLPQGLPPPSQSTLHPTDDAPPTSSPYAHFEPGEAPIPHQPSIIVRHSVNPPYSSGPPDDERAANTGTSEFSGLVSYFSSQQDDLNT